MSKVLTSWKEIAEFMGRGVRTVQRWEKLLGLPIHRPPASRRNVIFAMPEELTSWILKDRSSPENTLKIAFLFGTDVELRGDVRRGLEDDGYIVLLCSTELAASYLLKHYSTIDLLLVSSDVSDSYDKIFQKVLDENPRIQAFVVEGTRVPASLSVRCITIPRPLTSTAVLPAAIFQGIRMESAA